MAEPKHKKMYKNSPTLESDENGKKYIKKGPTESEKKTEEVDSGTDGMQGGEGMPTHARHAAERRDMNNRHETEHAMMDGGKSGDKKEMHGRHQKEMKDMHGRHEKETGVKDKVTKI